MHFSSGSWRLFLFSLFLYFLLAVSLLAAFLFPEWRRQALAPVGRSVARLGQMGRSLTRGSKSVLLRCWQALRHFAHALLRAVVEHRLLWSAAGLVLVISVLVGVLFGRNNVTFFDDRSPEIDAKVEALLKGEHLVPPAPLPPQVFATAEVEKIRPLTKEGSRDWEVLDPDFRARLLMVYKIMKEKHGYDLALLEGYRSPERQAKLAALGSNVTRAGANQSYHQFGLAADNAFYRNGKLVITEKDPWAMEGYRLYGEVAESMGLVWGGRWSFKDYGHVEYRKPGFKLSGK